MATKTKLSSTVRAFLFDMDGTLLDTREFIIQSTEHTLRKHGFPVPDRREISKLVGHPFNEFYQTLTGLDDDVTFLQNSHREFQVKNYHLSKPYPHALDVLRKIKERGFKTAIISTRGRRTSHETLRLAGMDVLLDAVITGDDAPVKPNPEGILKALAQLGEAPVAGMMIGDSYHDVEAGKNAGTMTIRATYGFHTEKLHDPEPDFFIDAIEKLLDLI